MTQPLRPGDMVGRRLHSQDRSATGSPVYGGGSNAATIGTVDPSGYVDRERRSGLAQQLLAGRTQPGGNRNAPGPAGGRTTTGDPSMVGETASQLDPAAVIRTLAARLARPQGG